MILLYSIDNYVFLAIPLPCRQETWIDSWTMDHVTSPQNRKFMHIKQKNKNREREKKKKGAFSVGWIVTQQTSFQPVGCSITIQSLRPSKKEKEKRDTKRVCTQSHALAISYDVVMAIVYMPNANTHYLWTTSCCRDVHTIRKYLLRGLCLSLALNCSCCATQLTSSIVLTFSSPCLYLVSKGKGKGKVSLPRKRGPFAGTEMDKRKLWGWRVSKKTKNDRFDISNSGSSNTWTWEPTVFFLLSLCAPRWSMSLLRS